MLGGNVIDNVFKVLLIGDAGVGKSSILLQFTDDYFNDNLQSTIGVDFKVKVMEAVDAERGVKRVKVTIWDTAGQERFRTLTSSYYRGAHGVILVYDVSRRDTFDSLSMWLQEIEQFSLSGGKDIVKLLVGNKVDLDRDVDRDVAVDWARSRGMLFLETSAKTKHGIVQVFNEIVQKIMENPLVMSSTRAVPDNIVLMDEVDATSGKKGKGCC